MTAAEPEQIFENSDQRLSAQASRIVEARHKLGLNGLVGDLVCTIINTQPDQLEPAVGELLAQTGYDFDEAFETPEHRSCVLTCAGSADILLQCRLKDENPFAAHNRYPKSGHLPDTRLETLVFACSDVARYAEVQKHLGMTFMTDAPIETNTYRFIQTTPSPLTGNSIGVIEWRGVPGRYLHNDCTPLDWQFEKPARPYLAEIGTLDHIATRVRTEDRDPAILEFMALTNYNFALAIHVPALNSITNVSRLEGARFSLVITSGIRSGDTDEAEGPTEQFVHGYGPRAHHMAFLTEDIDNTYHALHEDGLEFLSELVGDEAGGIKQAFSVPSTHTLLVNEYIKRYADFDGFFTQYNVTLLTLATTKQ